MQAVRLRNSQRLIIIITVPHLLGVRLAWLDAPAPEPGVCGAAERLVSATGGRSFIRRGEQSGAHHHSQQHSDRCDHALLTM
jgi:hypothetical protein